MVAYTGSSYFRKIMSPYLSYSVIDAALAGNDALMPAAEAHGILSSVLCVDMRSNAQLWLSLVFDDNREELVFSDADLGCLTALHEQTQQLLESIDFEFDLLLPEDDAPLPERADALSYWCKGFLYGLGAAKQKGEASDSYQEVLNDMNAIAQLDSDAEGETAEEDFLQVTEYVRAAVQTVWFEKQGGSDDPYISNSDENSYKDTLH